jgi:toxin ParE1/3/4
LNENPAVILRAARRDLIRYFAWLEAEAGTDTAERFLAAADRTFSKLAASPRMAPKVASSNPALVDLHKWQVDGFENLLIFYTVRYGGIEVLRVLHAASDWWALFDPDDNTP